MSSSPMMVMPPPRAAHRLSGHGSPDRNYVHEHLHRQNMQYQHSPPMHSSPPQHYQQYAPQPQLQVAPIQHSALPQPQAYSHRAPHSRTHSRTHSRSMSQHSHASSSAAPSLIERLPSELQNMVYSNLEYQQLIHLSTMNKYFHTSVQPSQISTADDKAAFVMRAVRDFPQHRPSEKGHEYKPGNFECYICFRVRSPDHFDMLQPQHAFVDARGNLVTDRDPSPSDRKITLRRFCIECGVREGLHAPFDCLTTRTGHDLWVCRCRRVWAKPGCLRCPDCRADCPLRPKKKNSF